MVENSIEPIFINSTSMGDVSGLIDSTGEDIEIKLLYRGSARDMFSENIRINNPLMIQGRFGYLTCLGGEVSIEGSSLRNDGSYHYILFKPTYIVEGSYDSEELKFNKVIIEVQDLSEWLQERRFDHTFTDDKEILSIDMADDTVHKFLFEDLTIKLINNLSRRHIKTDVTLRHQGCLVIELKEDLDLDNIEKLVIKIKYFLTLFTQYNVPHIERVSVLNTLKDRNEETYFSGVANNLYVRNINAFSDNQGISLGQCLYTYQSVKDQFGPMLNRWLEIYDQIKLPVNKFVYAVYESNLPIDTRFKEIITSLEGLHKLIQKLKYNKIEEQTLSERLDEMLTTLELIDNSDDKRDLIEKCKNTRHFFSHLVDKNQEVYNTYEMRELVPILREVFLNYILCYLQIKELHTRAEDQLQDFFAKSIR